MKRRFASFLLSAILCGLLTACSGSSSGTGSGTPTPTPTPPTPTPTLTFTEFPIQTSVSTEFGITTRAIGSNPFGITTGANGDIWFTEEAGKIGRITPGG